MKKIEYWIGYLFLQIIYLPFRFLSYESCLAIGRGIVKILRPLAKSKIKIARENILHALPNLSEKEREKILDGHIEYLGELVADSLYAPRINQDWLDKYFQWENNSEAIEERITKEPLGVVMISGHFGTWEVLVHWLGLKHKALGIYKKIRNPLVDKWYRSIREFSGISLVPMEDSAGPVFKGLKKGRWVGFGADQNAGRSGIFVQFLNRPASTFQGPAAMAYLTGARMILMSFLRGTNDKKVHANIIDLGVVEKEKFPDKESAIRHYTELWTHTLEGEIHKTPSQYFWVHRRWKTKPGDFPGQV
jgi:KDO2-lipid IV(A) lauroyltransferase